MHLYPFFLWLHILFAFMFYFAHGTSLAVAFRLRVEKDHSARKALLSISGMAVAPMFGGFTGMGVFGIALGIISAWWKHGWWWLSIALFLGMFAWMTWYSRVYYSPIRKALGLAYMTGFSKENPATGISVSEEEVDRLIEKTNPGLMAWVGLFVTMGVLFLMTYKPF